MRLMKVPFLLIILEMCLFQFVEYVAHQYQNAVHDKLSAELWCVGRRFYVPMSELRFVGRRFYVPMSELRFVGRRFYVPMSELRCVGRRFYV